LRFLLKLLFVFAKVVIITLVFESNAKFFAKNWQKLQKIVIITSTPEDRCCGHKIFCDFRQFSAQKIGVFLKNQCYDQNFAYFSFVLSQKRHFFSLNFLTKIFLKITTPVLFNGFSRLQEKFAPS
jgi:hypothetical protein